MDQWGEQGSRDGQLDRPSAMAFDAEDNLYLTDSLNHRVQKFTKDGTFLAKWGEEGDGPGQFNMPWGITLDRQGNVYVADWRNDRMQKFDSAGGFIAEWDGQGSADDRFNRPSGLAVDGEGDIYVCDWGNERVQVLSPAGETLASFRGDSITSTWSRDYFLANPEEGAARLEVRLGAGSGTVAGTLPRNIGQRRKTSLGPHRRQGGQPRPHLHRRQPAPPPAGIPQGVDSITQASPSHESRLPTRHSREGGNP